MAYSTPLHRLRWKGCRRWHRFHVGPLSLAFYIYRPGEHPGWRGTRLHVARHSWRYVDAEGVGRHALTFRRWVRCVSRVRHTRPRTDPTPHVLAGLAIAVPAGCAAPGWAPGTTTVVAVACWASWRITNRGANK